MALAVWGGFIGALLLLLAIDLFVLHRKARVVGVREALATTLMWVAVSLAFNIGIYFLYEHNIFGLGVYEQGVTAGPVQRTRLLPDSGFEAALMFFTGYLVELLLSFDTMLVIGLILGSFRIPVVLQHRVLFWGIIGAVSLRGIMIIVGAQLVEHYGAWVLPIFGVILILAAFKTLVTREDEADIERNLIVRASRRFFSVSSRYDGDRFLGRFHGKLYLTPLFVALLVVDVADLILAIESIPAVFGITTDPFLVFTSNCFAVLGLRSMYFASAAFIGRMRYVKLCTVFILGYIGIKMVTDRWYHIPPMTTLATIGAIMVVGIVASLVSAQRARMPQDRPIDDLTLAAEETWRRSRKIVILILGFTIVFIAAPAIGLLPGPGGIFVAIGGLALLATEFLWARKLLATMKTKALQVTGHAPSVKPPRLWKIGVVLLAYIAFVGLLMWAERTWGGRFPKLEKNWFYIAIGPGIAVTYWSIMTLRRLIQLRKGTATSGGSGAVATPEVGAPGAAGPEASAPTSALSGTGGNVRPVDGTGDQRQRAGST